MATEYDVRARLTLEGRRSMGTLDQGVHKTHQLQAGLVDATRAANGLWGKLLAIGGGYVGLSAGIGMFRRLTDSAVGYTAALEGTQIGLTSIIAAVENTSWENAAKRAKLAFDAVKQASLASPATPQEMFGIFQGIVGPIEAAGFSMQRVLDLTSDTVSAASALNVDFQQAQRDISLMVRGAAGMDVKLFSLLRSTGAIAESTEQWNKSLTAEERVNKLSDALAKFRQAGDRYGKSWSGVTSTFKGIVQEFGRAGFQPILDSLSGRLDTFNSYLLTNQDRITAYLQDLGTNVAASFGRVFDRAQSGFDWTIANWDRILDRAHAAAAMAKHLAPLGVAAYAAPAAMRMAPGLIAGGNMLASGLGGGGLGAWLGGGMGAAGGVAAGEAAAGGATAAAGTAAGTAVLGPLVLALAALGSMVAFASDHLTVLGEIWGNMTGGMTADLMGLWLAFKGAAWPLLKSWGGVLMMVLVPALQVGVFALRLLIKGFTWLFDIMGSVYSWIYDKLDPVFTMLLDFLELFSEGLQKLGRVLGMETERIRGMSRGEDPEEAKYAGGFDAWLAEHQGFMGGRGGTADPAAELLKKPPGARSAMTVNNDFRGSRISIKQDFKGKQDPDRLVAVMMRDLTRQAESRISSGFASALSR